MARQNTFTVIPQAPRFDADTATPARPMTSKQVRKAYKAATKTPTMTRAERIKWEREEQERIKKDFEKEKTAAKARAAREKKKEKEIQQREEKRRNGLPLVNVRPSQDTIARFVRGNGSTKKRDAEGMVVTAAKEVPVEEPKEQQDADAAPLDASVTALGPIMEAEEDMDEDTISANSTSDRPPLPNTDNATEHNAGANDGQTPICNEKMAEKDKQQDIGLISEDYDVNLGLEEPIDDASLDAALRTVPKAEPGTVSDAGQPADETNDQVEQPETESTNFMLSQDLLDEEINTDMLDELDELLSGGKTPAKPQPVSLPSSYQNATKTTPTKHMSQRHTQNIIGHDSTSPRQEKRKPPSQRKVQNLSSPRQAPPTCTQAILVNFDDFFPTSSQQLRELEDEQEPSQDEATPQRPPYTIHESTTPDKSIEPQSGPQHSALAKAELDLDEFESEFSSFPSTAHFSVLKCSVIPQQPPRHTPQMHTSTPGQSVARPQPVLPLPSQPQPSRFFTSSGSREQLSLALQRSRRSAALEQIQEKERQRQEAGLVMQQSKHDEARRPASPTRPCNAPEQDSNIDKENVPLPEMRCSQETEYGGDWVEDAAWDLALY